MCGICGEIRFDQQPVDSKAVHSMNQQMASRGPDDSGIHIEGHRGFGHRRLMIMDVTSQSHQPMIDAELGLGIVFNGAIYNYQQLRNDLISKGYTFSSDGDTEVILKAYHAWGIDCVARFNGMFAFAIWEKDTRQTVIARDRLGIKPLYYSQHEQFLRFASTLPALLKTDIADKTIDPVAINYYLNFHAVVPSPHTIISGVRKLPPAHYMIIQADGRVQQQAYWQLSFAAHPENAEKTEEEWRNSLLSELREAVKRRQIAAVDVGVLLSGGLDSSLLVGLMAEAGQPNLHTYSVGFESVDEEAGDEFMYSDIIAETFQTRHHQIRVSSDELLTQLPNAIQAMSEPMVSHDCIGFYLLSREVSKTCKAVQSGQGADEVFGGYHWYPPLLNSSDPLRDYAKVFFDRDYAEYQQTVSEKYLAGDQAKAFVRDHFQRSGADHPVDKALRLDTTVMLIDDPVKRVDNMTMAWGLEARVPFLDHQLVEFAATIPPELKLASDGKYILKEAAREVIPASVIDRPKGYFPVPALKYLRGSVLNYVKDALTNQQARQRGLFNKDYVDKLLDNPEHHITPLRGSKLWQLGLLEIWLQTQSI